MHGSGGYAENILMLSKFGQLTATAMRKIRQTAQHNQEIDGAVSISVV